MLFAARPGPKKLVGGKLTKDAAAALFEKYYGPDAVMEQILGASGSWSHAGGCHPSCGEVGGRMH